MIIIRLSGGIGNQMFQYALYLKLISLGREVKIDDETEYLLENRRPIMLPVFGIDYPRAGKDEITSVTDSSLKLTDRIRRKLRGRKSKEYHEASMNYDPEVLRKEEAYLCGCFQSENYFEDISDQVREAYQFRNLSIPAELEEAVSRYEEQIRVSCAVSLHIRRGDYLDAQDVYGGICTEEYYDSAAGFIKDKLPDARFYIFTNDPDWPLWWCNQRADRECFTIIRGTTEDTGYIDLMLMSKCKHHIIANSSFSWWGAFLGRRKESVVIAPGNWLRGKVSVDIYTKQMIRIGVGEPLVSIIVAVYNIEEYISRCVESILAQTYEKLEVLLVDDGSTDRSGDICDQYAEKDRRIRVIHKENGGLSDARNAGLRAATGEYIGFVDGDDWIEPQMYDAMVKSCAAHQAQIAVCRYKQITKSGIIDASTGNSVLLTGNEALEIYVCGDQRYLIYNSVWSKLFHRRVIEGMEFPLGKNSEDIMFTTKAFCRMERCVYLDTAYYNYVLDREGSIMNEKAGERRLQHEIPFWREQIAYFAGQGKKELADKAAYHFYRRLLFYYIEFMQQQATRQYAKELIGQIRQEREEIDRIYAHSYVKNGDKVRMKLILFWPDLYYRIVKLYDSVVIPLRNKKISRFSK